MSKEWIVPVSEWEWIVPANESSRDNPAVRRLRVPGGWLYQIGREVNYLTQWELSPVFVPYAPENTDVSG